MPIPLPNLDDRDFRSLMEQARARVRASSTTWTDLGPSDPGVILLETFAHLTEIMLYRLNRLPEKSYRAYLNLLGVDLLPPTAARTDLVFTRVEGSDTSTRIRIPRGTRVATAGTSTESEITFTVVDDATLLPADTQVVVPAQHCQLVDAEPLGVTSADPLQTYHLAQGPVLGPPDEPNVEIAIEATNGEGSDGRKVGAKTFQLLDQVPALARAPQHGIVAAIDREQGTVRISSGWAAQPLPANLEIRAWYRIGGGADGNVAADTLTRLVDPIPGVEVVNPQRATGGTDVETVEHAVSRGPREFYARERAVTERDYEDVALRSGAVSRARAYASADVWAFAPPGSVEIVLVPEIGEAARIDGRVTLDQVHEHSTSTALEEVEAELAKRRPLSIQTTVTWAHHKTVAVHAHVVVRRGEDAEAVRRRVQQRLHQTINPLPSGQRVRASLTDNWRGWPFGEALRVSDVYDILLAEPGVAWADNVTLHVQNVPDTEVKTLAADNYQDRVWYAGAGHRLFRSSDDAEGWELVKSFDPGSQIRTIEPYPYEPERAGLGQRPGYVATAVRRDTDGSDIYLSRDLGETWGASAYASFDKLDVKDLAWIQRDGQPLLLVATASGLYELAIRDDDRTPSQIVVDPAKRDLGFYQVVAYTRREGGVTVIVAANDDPRGCYLSTEAGRTETYSHAGLRGEDIRALAVQYQATDTYLWAGTASAGPPGNGCFRARMEERLRDNDQGLPWRPFSQGWEGGSCWAITFSHRSVYAASEQAGVQRLDLDGDDPHWSPSDVRCGLPMEKRGEFFPVHALASDESRRMLLAGGPGGVFRSDPASEAASLGSEYRNRSQPEFTDAVTIPSTWLFVSGEHDLKVEHG